MDCAKHRFLSIPLEFTIYLAFILACIIISPRLQAQGYIDCVTFLADDDATDGTLLFSTNYVDSAVKDLELAPTYSSTIFHLFSHGKPGYLLIDDEWKDVSQIVDWLQSNRLLVGKNKLNIYGCEFAKGEKGKAAVSYLEAVLDISTAASDDITGIDGDWELEVGSHSTNLSFPEYKYNLQCPSSGCVSTEEILIGEWGSDCIKLIDRNTGLSSNWQCTGVDDPNFMIQIGDSIYVNNAGLSGNVTFYSLTGTYLGVAATGFSFPEQMRVGPDGLLYITDQTTDDILAYDISTIPWTQSYVVDNNFNAAHGIDFDEMGNLYVTNNGAPNTMTRFNGPPPYSNTNTTVITTESDVIRGIATGPDGNVYFLVNSNPQLIKEYNTSSGVISTFITLDAGSGVFSGVHWGPDGQFYLSDFGESELTEYDPSGTLVNTYNSGLTNPHTVVVPVTTSSTSCSVTGNGVLCAGDNLVLQENGGAAVEWCWEGPNGFNATTPSITINNIATTDAGTYSVVITDASGCVSEPCEVDVTVACYDYGDLPDTAAGTSTLNYETDAANTGPSHLIVTGLSIGTLVDQELDGQASSDALGDGADEDGFSFPSTLDIVSGGSVNIPIDVTNTTGTTANYEIWVDWNGDGDFNDSNEMVADLSDDGSGNFGQAFFTVNIPANASTNQLLGFRARLSHTDNMTPNGEISSGEVEDYLIMVTCKPAICLPIQAVKN